MTNYIIEGNIDFYSELYKSLDESSDLQSDNLCLITSEPLKENYITLDCNHKFNYVAIYNDIVTCKTKTSYLDTQHLSFNEIRCPYCRKKQSRLLPYYENMGLKKIHGVNYVDETLLYSSHYKIGKCSFQNENENENICCSNTYVSKLKEDGKDYCYQHKKLAKAQIVKNILLKKKEEKEKEKEAQKQAKEAEKLAKQAAKQAAKELVKKAKTEAAKEKAKAKANTQNKSKKSLNLTNTSENIVISGEPIVIDANYCVQILKTGSNKGQQCKMKKTNSDYCLRHFNLANTSVMSVII